MNLEQIIKRQEEKLPKLIVDLVWSVTDGGCKLKENQLLSYQDEPVREYEDIINWHSSSIKEILEGVVEFHKKLKKNNKDVFDLVGLPVSEKNIKILVERACDGRQDIVLDDTINHLESIINQLK